MIDPRYIAIVGEDWSQMLGTDKAKYLTPKVGIILHGDNDSLRNGLNKMQIMSGNVDLALYPLEQIIRVMVTDLQKTVKGNRRFEDALVHLEIALAKVHACNAAYHMARK